MAKQRKLRKAAGSEPADRYVVYRERHFAGRGMMALVSGLLSILLLAALVLWSIYSSAGAGQAAGAVGIGALWLAGVGLWAGLKSFGDRCRSYAVSKAGTILCGIAAAAWFLIACWGLAH